MFAMSSTYLSLHYHVVFGTKHRVPIIDKEWRFRLHDYLGGTIRGLGCIPQCVGGVADHVHILMGLKATHRLSDTMRELKKASAVWVHQEINNKNFSWQEGYAAFTVSATARDGVHKYIINQEDHHRTRSSIEELVEMLEMAGVECDQKYLE